MANQLTVNISEKRINSYLKGVDSIYRIAIMEASSLVSSLNHDSSKPFTWDSYPQTKAKIDKVINRLFSNFDEQCFADYIEGGIQPEPERGGVTLSIP